ncbi:MAG: hypothetical protein LBC53_04680 [Spirochaetaceae bacterium]|jgi:uracil-DNA glycosylase family 4|nr:hypothetical protein [Spirochaetaceae bacterium]
MTAEQKQNAAHFLDAAEDFLYTGYSKGLRLRNFSDDPSPGVFSDFATGVSKAFKTSALDLGKELERLNDEIAHCRCCPLAGSRKLSGLGVLSRPLVLVLGEAPVKTSDGTPLPFGQEQLQFLDKMLFSIGLSSKTNCFVTSLVKCAPEEGVPPDESAKKTCRHFLNRQIDFLNPYVILLIGDASTKSFFSDRVFTGTCGCWNEWQSPSGRKISTLPFLGLDGLVKEVAKGEEKTLRALAWKHLKTLSRRLVTLDSRYEKQIQELRKEH